MAGAVHDLQIRLGLVGAHCVQWHGQRLLGAGNQHSLQKHALPQALCAVVFLGVNRQINRHGAGASLGTGADTHHLRLHRCAGAFYGQSRLLAHAHLRCVSGRHQRFDFQALQVHHFQNARVHANALAVLNQALRHKTVYRAAQHRVGKRLAQHIHSRHCRLIVGFAGIQAGLRRFQCGFRNKTLRHQSAVVVELPLADGRLGVQGVCLLLGLAHTGLGFGGINTRDFLAGAHRIAFAQHQTLQLTRHPGLDGGRLHRPHRARNGYTARNLARLQDKHFAQRDFHGQCFGLGRAGLRGLARRHAAQHTGHHQSHQHGRDQPGNPTFHKGCIGWEKTVQGLPCWHRPYKRQSSWCSIKRTGSKF